jgi:hypothetical protein
LIFPSLHVPHKLVLLSFGLISPSLPTLSVPVSGGSGLPTSGGGAGGIGSRRRLRWPPGGGRRLSYGVIGAVISTPVRGWVGGWDERSERRRWRGGAAGVPGLEREQRERNAFSHSPYPQRLSSPPSFPLLRLWICAFLRRRLKLTVSF